MNDVFTWYNYVSSVHKIYQCLALDKTLKQRNTLYSDGEFVFIVENIHLEPITTRRQRKNQIYQAKLVFTEQQYLN